jgi:hypothetical protein
MAITITWPQANFASAVVLTGTGPGGAMCVTGTITGAGRGGNGQGQVLVKVFNGSLTMLPGTPPPSSTPATITGQTWVASNVPAPTSSATRPFPPLTVVAWETAGTGYDGPQGVLTCGMQAAHVDCGSGSGVPCGTGLGPALAAGRAGAFGGAVVALAPVAWGLTVGGFAAAGGLLNGTWLLELRDGGGLWDNGGDGTLRPRVELCCDGPPAGLWRLRLCQGELAVEYTAPADWEALGPLTLGADDPGPHPRTLTVLPV